MKRLGLILTFVAVLVLAACMQNNGHIGHWFGQWKVERITIDGTDDPDYQGDCFFCFQSGVFGMRKVDGGVTYARWTEDKNTGIVTVSFKEAYGVSGACRKIYLDDDVTFRLVSHKGRKKVLEQLKDNGKTYTYYLTKW